MSLREIRISNLSDVDVLEQYIGPWSIDDRWANEFMSLHNTIDMATHDRTMATSVEVEVQDSVAIIELSGLMTKRGSSFSRNSGTVRVRKKLRAAQKDPDVKSVLLVVESPGGTLAGTKELADEVRATVDGGKPVVAYIEDLGASAAYYVASQATKVFSNRPALVGSIGTYMVLVDSSQAAEDIGIKVHVIRAGEFKGVGIEGTEVTEDHLSHFQAIINDANTAFLDAVKSGRRLDDNAIQGVATGKVFTATEALRLGLIDGVRSYDEAFNHTRELSMSEQSTKPKAATLKELKSALVGADSDFLISQLDDDATLQDAQEAWIIEQGDRLTKSQAETEAAKAKAQSVGPEPLGEELAKGSTRTSESSAKDEWTDLVNKKAAGGQSRMKAVSAVNRENPGLREEMLFEVNV